MIPAWIRTVITVVVLSCLIWVFAERRVIQTEQLPVDIILHNELAPVTDEQSQPRLLLEYLENGIPIGKNRRSVQLKVRGRTGLIREIKNRRILPELPQLDVATIGYSGQGEPEIKTVSVVKAILDSKLQLEGEDSFLEVVEAKPAELHVRLTPLVQRQLPVMVFGQDDRRLTRANVKPETVSAWVVDGQAEARVVLRADEQVDAGSGVIEAICRVKVAGLEPQQSTVQVELPAGDSPWETRSITPRLGIVWPYASKKAGRFVPEIEDDPHLRDQIICSGSKAALDEFENSQFHLLLEIKPTDKPGKTDSRTLRFNWPDEHAEFKITNATSGVMVKFQLVPVEDGGS